MKKNIFLFCLLLILLSGCSDFLEESSQDEVRPSTIADLEQILIGNGYFSTSASGVSSFCYNMTDYFTDDIQCNGVNYTEWQSNYDEKIHVFAWEDNMFKEDGNGDDPRFWQFPYEGIGGCNIVLDYLDEMKGEEVDRENIRGEALVLRAWYYFQLVNLFGLPYNYGDPNTNLGVPIQLTSSVTEEEFPRNTVQEVYDQIIKDMTHGRQLMIQNPKAKNYYRINEVAAAAMLSRVYLYMEDWDKALAYADTVLSKKSALLDLNSLEKPNLVSTNYANSVYAAETPTEIIWGRQVGGTLYSTQTRTEKYPWSVDESLIQLMFDGKSWQDVMNGEVNDLRAMFYFCWASDGAERYPLGLVKDKDFGKFQGTGG